MLSGFGPVFSMILEHSAILRCSQSGTMHPLCSKNRPPVDILRSPFPSGKTSALLVDNPKGMRLKFAQEGNRFVCRFKLGKRYTGPPGYCHGGIIATILDDAMGKLCKLRQVVAVTSKIAVEYMKPVPLHKPLRVESRELSRRGRRLTHKAEILSEEGGILARSQGVFIIIDPERMFGRK
jgi:uncharacterized protein (TIGR00369 family)